MNDKRFWGLPMCLETPKGPDLKKTRELDAPTELDQSLINLN